ncbi:MAG: hypothetical protein BWY53_00512 [Parcubacteria group bacterium ADurb.Bin326]|nr:MAG: hypothetical protein BWY53_00512 [Parcubacteria group bacterium ADurb.Bin326]
MNQVATAVIPNTLIQPFSDTLESFRQGVDNLLAKRSYFISQVLPKLQENQDYYEIKGRKSLAKGGAEKLASIYNLTATFQRDDETMNSFSSVKDMIAYVCTLYRGNQIIGQGRGAAILSKNQGDINKTLKMAQKSAYIDAVIRSTGLSDIFTQDLETVFGSEETTPIQASNFNEGMNPQLRTENRSEGLPETDRGLYMMEQADDSGFIPATEKQKSYLSRLISQKYFEPDEMEDRFKTIEGLSKYEASQLIDELLNS